MKKNSKKRKTPTEIIESTSRPDLETSYRKPGRGKFMRRLIQLRRPKKSIAIIRRDLPDFGIHTHPYTKGEEWNAIPSHVDIREFLRRESKMDAVAQRDSSTGKVMGYTFLRKTRKYEEHVQDSSHLRKTLFVDLKKIVNSTEFPEGLDEYLDKIKNEHIKIRFVPAPGYKFDKETGNYVPKEKSLEGTVITAIIASFVLVAVFLNKNLTGFITSNPIQNRPVILVPLLIIVIFLIYFSFNYINKRRMIKLIEERLNKKDR